MILLNVRCPLTVSGKMWYILEHSDGVETVSSRPRLFSRDRDIFLETEPRPRHQGPETEPRPRHLQKVSRPSRDIQKPVSRLPRAETPVSRTPSLVNPSSLTLFSYVSFLKLLMSFVALCCTLSMSSMSFAICGLQA